MDHGEAFMSMIDVTKNLPRSGDGLAMDWIDVPFGPFFPGLPGGLLLTLTLDGDTIAGVNVDTLVGNQPLLSEPAMDIHNFNNRLASLAPMTPVSYQVLSCLAIENAAGIEVDPQIARARVVAVERERIVSHLGWLVLFAEQTGFDWLQHRAARLQQDLLHGDMKQKQVSELKSAVLKLNKRLQRTPLLESRTSNIGKLSGNADITLLGPVARASGINNDARVNDKFYTDMGFTPVSGKVGDARARLQLRVDEISQSLRLIEKTGFATHAEIYNISGVGETGGAGEAVLETPRGRARLQLSLEKGRVITAQLDTPSTHHLDLIEQLTAQQELGDALVTIGSLDLSPWEIRS
ncbi:MAG: hypothetical protein BMS9Abin33_0365 [Gammaproteobacteria bacterium]|nr:MAG: hypothetical protein BMS9Abin33_0365 [Gammaproteobacteria bacterium]